MDALVVDDSSRDRCVLRAVDGPSFRVRTMHRRTIALAVLLALQLLLVGCTGGSSSTPRPSASAAVTAPASSAQTRTSVPATLQAAAETAMADLVAPGSSPSACDPGAPMDTTELRTMGEPATTGKEHDLAVDGDPTSGWDPGGTRGPGGVRGWLRILLPRPALVSQVRVLLGTSVASVATYRITGWGGSGGSTELGAPRGGATDGQRLEVAGPQPCVPLSSIDVAVESDNPAAMVMEVEIVGTAAP